MAIVIFLSHINEKELTTKIFKQLPTIHVEDITTKCKVLGSVRYADTFGFDDEWVIIDDPSGVTYRINRHNYVNAGIETILGPFRKLTRIVLLR